MITSPPKRGMALVVVLVLLAVMMLVTITLSGRMQQQLGRPRSRLEYQQAQDTLENAKLDVQTAELGLVSAFNQYEWAKRGLTTAIA